MPADLLDETADDAEVVTVAWMLPLRPTATGIRRVAGDTLPFTLIRQIPGGKENVDEGTIDVVVEVNTLCDRNLGGEDKGWSAARAAKDDTHRRMLLLARHLPDVPLAGGRNATIDYVKVFEHPHRQPHEDAQIIRYVARYTLGLSYSAVS